MNLKTPLRRLLVLLLCLSMMTGLVLPAFAAPAEGEPAEPVVLTVYEQTEGGEAKVVKTYKPFELAALKTTGTAGYQYWKNGEETILAATEYVTIDSLLTDAGLTFSENDTLQAAAADGFSSRLTYAESQSNKYFFTNGSKTEVPAALALSWSTGKGALEEVAAAA